MPLMSTWVSSVQLRNESVNLKTGQKKSPKLKCQENEGKTKQNHKTTE